MNLFDYMTERIVRRVPALGSYSEQRKEGEIMDRRKKYL